jgi:hypothetical protein
MEDNTNKNSGNNSSGKKMDPTRDLYEKLISEVYKYKLEEREMALDRYRRADAQMDTSESFILMGKNAIDFLKQAANASDGISSLAKEIKSIVYKEDSTSNVEVNFNDATKRALIDAIKEEENNNAFPDEDLEDK